MYPAKVRLQTQQNKPATQIVNPLKSGSQFNRAKKTVSQSRPYQQAEVKQQQQPSKSSNTNTVRNTMPRENWENGEPTFPIDLVYTWVDGSDEELIQLRSQYMGRSKVHSDSASNCRWRDLDELRHSVDSANKYAPWLRKIFIISDHQRPYWFDENNPGKVVFVDHPQLFGEYEEHLPTFNSHAIECHLHRVPGLSEHFIYANDDTFFGAPCQPSDFFTADGRFRVYLSKFELPPGKPAKDEVPYTAAQQNVRELITSVFKVSPGTMLYRLKHQMKPLRRSTFEKAWENEVFMLYLFNTSSNRFRDISDIDPTCLVAQMGLLTGNAISSDISSKYYTFQDKMDPRKVFKHLYKWRPTPKLYCINDVMEAPTPTTIAMIQKGMDKFLPHRAVPRSAKHPLMDHNPTHNKLPDDLEKVNHK